MLEAHWRDPALVFSQTCWGPLSLGLIDALEPLAQPDYSTFAGGRGGMYRAAVVGSRTAARALNVAGDAPVPDDDGSALPAGLLRNHRFAFNARDSLSGYIALGEDLGDDPCAQAADCIETGGHRESVRLLVEGRADLAAIDCRSWALARRFEPGAKGLVVVGWTAERPGLPYVTSRATDPVVTRDLRQKLLTMGCHAVAPGRNG